MYPRPKGLTQIFDEFRDKPKNCKTCGEQVLVASYYDERSSLESIYFFVTCKCKDIKKSKSYKGRRGAIGNDKRMEQK